MAFFPLDSGFRFGVEGKAGEGWPSWDGAERKQAVLSVAFRYLDTYRELLQEEGERSNSFPKVLVQHTFMEHARTCTYVCAHTRARAHVHRCAHIHTRAHTHRYTTHARTHKQTSSRTMV